MSRAVVDLNVLVSAVINPKGAPARTLALWQERRFALILSVPMLSRLARVLSSPKLQGRWVDGERAWRLILELMESAELVPGRTKVVGMVRDPDDDEVLAAAVEGGVDYIVTGDNDLLVLGRYEAIPIVSPASFIEIIEAR